MIFRPRRSARVASVIFSFGAFSVLFMPWRISSVFFMPSLSQDDFDVPTRLDLKILSRILLEIPTVLGDFWKLI